MAARTGTARSRVDLATELRSLGFDDEAPSAAVVPVLIGDAREAVALSERLFEAGVFCPAIRPPSVPAGTSRLRVTAMATHTDEHIDRVLDAFAGRTSTRTQRDVRHDVFVTGTDTGVGKTIVTAALARRLSDAGVKTVIFKPFQTGAADGDDDAGLSGQLSGVDAVNDVVLAEPLAPSVAAERAGMTIDVDAVRRRFEKLQGDYEAVIVEGAGGLLVPIVDGYTMADFACELRLPVVVVARPALGTLNHTALTIEVAQARGLEIEGIVVSGFPALPTVAEETNLIELEKLTGINVVAVIPQLERIEPSAFDDVERWFDTGA